MDYRFNEANIFIDKACTELAEYLKEKINKKSSSLFNYTLIKSTRTFDSITVPNQEYPLLKVFRSGELFGVGKSKKNVNAIIRYCLILPEMEKIMPLCTWIANEIHHNLNNYYKFNNCYILEPTNRKVEYSVIDAQSTSFAYSFMNYYYSFME